MSKKERRSYDKSFKLMAVELYRNGKPAGTVAKELGIGVDMVRRWSREYSAHDTRNPEYRIYYHGTIREMGF